MKGGKTVNPPIRVTAGILVNNQKVLVAKRRNTSHLGGLWEFPGGKIEDAESAAGCLERELEEELRIKIDRRTVSFFDTSFYEYGLKRIFLIGMTVTRFFGDICPVEHEETRWVEISGLETIALAPADVPFARRLIRYSDVAKE